MESLLVRAGVERYLSPADVGEAYRLLLEFGDIARLVGGGTDLALHPPAGVKALIDLSRLPLSYIESRSDGVAIGAMTTLTEMLDAPVLAGFARGVLPQMLVEVGSPALRNVATLGGHVVRARMSDLIPVLLVLDAAVRLFDGTDRTMPLQAFLDARPHRLPVLVTEFVLPARSADLQAAFVRFSRAAFDFAILNCAGALDFDGGRIRQARLVVGETPRLGRRIDQVEEHLSGLPLDDQVIEEAARLAQNVVSTGDDQRASASYRTQLVYVGVRRCLRAAAGRAEAVP